VRSPPPGLPQDAGQLRLKIKRGQEKGGMSIGREQVDEIAKDKAKWQELTDILYQQDFSGFFRRTKKDAGAAEDEQPAAVIRPASEGLSIDACMEG
jgi:hypothetical protein